MAQSKSHVVKFYDVDTGRAVAMIRARTTMEAIDQLGVTMAETCEDIPDHLTMKDLEEYGLNMAWN
jgi:hypothetical protein